MRTARTVTPKEQQELFDLLASLVEWDSEMGGFEAPVWTHATQMTEHLRSIGMQRRKYLSDYRQPQE